MPTGLYIRVAFFRTLIVTRTVTLVATRMVFDLDFLVLGIAGLGFLCFLR